MGTGVDTAHPDYIERLEDWDKMTDVCISETHMMKQGIKYIPILDEMTATQYDAYIKRAEFPMFTKHALESFVGMSMRKELLISGISVDHPFFKNCDGKGSSIKAYSEKLVSKFLQYGRCGTLIDMPEAAPNMSIAAAVAANIKVRLAFYTHTSIINWKTSLIANEEVLTLVVLKEQEDVGETEFDHEYEDVYRVLKLDSNGEYIQVLYDEDGDLIKVIRPLMNGKPFKFIPFIIHGGVDVRPPVLLPIAEQNIHWYMKDADYQHGLHYTALPTPYVIGVDPEDKNAPKSIGPTKLWFLPEDCSCGMLEFTGAGLDGISKSMDKTMSNITVLSSQILVPKDANDETATAASIRNATETASLSSIVSFLSEELTNAVVVASQWGSFEASNTSVKINSDFIPLTLSGADVSAYVSAVLKQGFSQKTLFELLKRGEVIEGDRQYEDEIADIEKERKRREDNEVELAKRLAEVEAALAKLTKPADEDPSKQSDDVKDKSTQSSASVADTNSGTKKSADNN